MLLTVIIIIFILTVVAGYFAFRATNAPTFGGANILFYFLLFMFIATLVVGIGQQYVVNEGYPPP